MRWPSWLTWYKKPDYRDIKEYSRDIRSGKRSFSPDGRGSAIPSQLKLERVLDNKTCSPMSLYDFYMYLKYIEFSEENVEFYIWYKNYERNYVNISGEKDDASFYTSQSTSSEVTLNDPKALDFPSDAEAVQHTVAQIARLITSGGTCARSAKCKLKCANCVHSSGYDLSEISGYATNSTTTLNNPVENRKELNTIVQTFLVSGAPKELNIPPAMRDQAIMDLKASCDPSHLRPVADYVYQLLRTCSHRNFVRLGVSNGTFETICVATGLGIVLTVAGFLAVLLLAFTPHRGSHLRWTVFGVWPMWWLGMSLIISGLRGSCFFLLLFTRRQPMPWERFTEDGKEVPQPTGLMRILSRLMIFDRKFRVNDVHLRHLQHKIVLQSLVGGAIFASVSVLVFIFLPVWSTPL